MYLSTQKSSVASRVLVIQIEGGLGRILLWEVLRLWRLDTVAL